MPLTVGDVGGMAGGAVARHSPDVGPATAAGRTVAAVPMPAAAYPTSPTWIFDSQFDTSNVC